MKANFFLFLLSAALGLAGCSASREGQNDGDTIMTDTMNTVQDSMRTDTGAIDTLRTDSLRRDTL